MLQMTARGSCEATSITKSDSPLAAISSRRPLATSRMCVSQTAVARGVKALLMSRRIFTWRGGSMVINITPKPVPGPCIKVSSRGSNETIPRSELKISGWRETWSTSS